MTGLLCCSAGIRNHQGVHPLSEPGTADLSAWVDFSAMRMAAEQAFDIQPASSNSSAPPSAHATSAAGAMGAGAAETSSSAGGRDGGSAAGVEVFGPVTQAHLLHSLGIQARLQSLAEVSRSSHHRLFCLEDKVSRHAFVLLGELGWCL